MDDAIDRVCTKDARSLLRARVTFCFARRSDAKRRSLSTTKQASLTKPTATPHNKQHKTSTKAAVSLRHAVRAQSAWCARTTRLTENATWRQQR
jgi:hypothetical protein